MDAVLNHLKLERETPSLDYLNRLLKAWSQHIPWESASRVARHGDPGTPDQYAWLPEVYFQKAVSAGTGGTCFESNLAFRSLLVDLGFEVTLHFCDMEDEISDPHCTTVVHIDGHKYLADVGYPVPAAIELAKDHEARAETGVYTFAVTPDEAERWTVRRNSGDFSGISFWVKAAPVDEDVFVQRLLKDHEDDGLFLKEVIIQKMAGDVMWRYSTQKGLIRRTVGLEEAIALDGDLVTALSQHFSMDEDIIRRAFEQVSPQV